MSDRTELSTLGEFGLIEHLTRDIKNCQPSTEKGIGDDACVLHFTEDKVLVSSDILTEGVHFDLSYMPLKHLGYKAAIVNFSDIAAMNALPSQLLVNIALSNRFSLEAVEEIYEGIRIACEKYAVDLVGGDTSSSKSGLVLSLTVIGSAAAENIVYRNTARPGNLICVSGDLGAAYTGLLLLEREKAVFLADPALQPDLEAHEYIVQRQLKPEARTDVVIQLAKLKIQPTAMMDISDGLASDIKHICHQSGTGCKIYEDKLPLDPAMVMMAEEFEMLPAVCALNGGEDYELLFCIDAADYDRIKTMDGIHVIGYITEKAEGQLLITGDNKALDIEAQGWDAFKSSLNKA